MSWIELRVHGVSGTPPESLLGVPHAHQVAGDTWSRFFRPVRSDGTEQPHPDGHVLEAYHWGRFTSGTWRQGLALLLLPFGLVNAAQFMLPAPARTGRAGLVGRVSHLVAGAALRATGLLLTSLIAFTLGLVTIDIVGWRWALEAPLLDGVPDAVVVVAAVLAAALGVVGLAVLGLSTRTRRPPISYSDPDAPPSSALDPKFYTPDPNAWTMRMLHTATGLAMVALLASLTRQPQDSHGSVGGPAAWLLLAVAVVVVVAGDPERTVTIGFTDQSWTRPMKGRGLRVVALGSLVLAAGVLALETWQAAAAVRGYRPPSAVRDGAGSVALTDFDTVAHALMVSGVALLVLLLATNAVLALAGTAPDEESAVDARAFRPYARGMTSSLVAGLSVFLGVAFSAAAANATAAVVPATSSEVVPVASGSGETVSSTEMLDRVSYAWGLTLVVLLGLLLAAGVRSRLSRAHHGPRLDAAYKRPAGDTSVLPDEWRGRVLRAVFLAHLKNTVPWVVIVFVGVGLLVAAVQLYEAVAGPAPWPLDLLSQARGEEYADPLIALGSWVLVALAGAVLTISRGALRDTGLRRGINVVWDVFSFWPHAVHPFVPRPYSRWAVVELRNRIRHHLATVPAGPAGSPRRVVVAAHSQGSLLTYAALIQLTEAERRQVAFVSCGSQLRVIYPRAFPAYVNLTTHRWLFRELDGAWVNLYRLTDPLAGPVLSWLHRDADTSRHFDRPLGPRDGIVPAGDATAPDRFPSDEGRRRECGHDWRLLDPVPTDPALQTGAVTGLRGHSDFWHDPAWPDALDHARR